MPRIMYQERKFTAQSLETIKVANSIIAEYQRQRLCPDAAAVVLSVRSAPLTRYPEWTAAGHVGREAARQLSDYRATGTIQ